MSLVQATSRVVPGDWYAGKIPENVFLAESAYLETSYSFLRCRSELPEGVRIGDGSSVYLGSMFDVGPRGRVEIGEFVLVNGAWFICDEAIEIGDYALISWNVVFMDNYRVPLSPSARALALRRGLNPNGADPPLTDAKPICIGRNTWIGFDCCILPGVTVGEGAIVGARSVVTSDVPPYTVAAGNPARIIRQIENDEIPKTF
jgi:acetyltransferase-like isoleucine patch superfamily enzyme